MLLQHCKNKTHSPAASYSKHAWRCLIFKQRKGRNHTNLIYHLVSLYNQMKVADTLKYTPKFLLGFVLLGPWWNVWSPINLKHGLSSSGAISLGGGSALLEEADPALVPGTGNQSGPFIHLSPPGLCCPIPRPFLARAFVGHRRKRGRE